MNRGTEKKQYELLNRVRRWEGDNIDINTMRNFSDNGWRTYAHLTDEELWLQRAFHYLPGVVDLLNEPEHRKYFIKPPRDKAPKAPQLILANASLVLLPKKKNSPKEVYLNGKLIICIDADKPNKIYHMMFHPKANTPSLKVPYTPCLKIHKPYQEHAKKVGGGNKHDNAACQGNKIKKYGYFNKKENDYIIEYIPPEQAPQKLIKLYIHPQKHEKRKKRPLLP